MKSVSISISVSLYSPEEFGRMVLKSDKVIRAWAIYHKMPNEVSDADIQREILLPLAHGWFADKYGRICYQMAENRNNHLFIGDFIKGSETLPANRTYIVVNK